MDIAALEKNITPYTKAIIAVDIFGHSADMDFWCALVKQNLTRHQSFIYKHDKKFDLSDESIKGFLLPMVIKKKKTLEPIDSTMNIKNGNQIIFLINTKNDDCFIYLLPV